MSVKTNILLESGTNELEVVEFQLKYKASNSKQQFQPFGINVAKVREIIRMPELTKLPNMPRGVYGVFSLRNSIIPALDLSKYLFNIENDDTNQKMIITEFNKIQCGFIVNDVSRIHRISWSKIDSPEALQDFDTQQSSIIGIIKFEDKNILMLDVEKIIAEISPESAIDNTVIKQMVKNKPIVITAEDSQTIRKLITDRLKIAGFDIMAFNDGIEAWEKLSSIADLVAKGEPLSKYVNLVITDIEMPRLDGYSLVKNIKTNQYLASLPVVIFSSIITNDQLHKGKSVGVDAQLTKPQIGELLDVVRLLIDNNNRIIE